MKIKGKITINNSFTTKLNPVPELAEDIVRRRLHEIADTTIRFSTPFIKSGAYITSFSFSTGAGRPRGYTLHGRPESINKGERASVGMQQLIDDINKIQDFSKVGTLYLRNNAPHAYPVELKHRVFAQIKNIEAIYG